MYECVCKQHTRIEYTTKTHRFHATALQSLSSLLGIRIPNLITGPSEWRAPIDHKSQTVGLLRAHRSPTLA